MAVCIITAPPAGGKTSYCVQRVAEIRRSDPLIPLKIITANKNQMAYWKKTLARGTGKSENKSGCIGMEITSFTKFAKYILDKISGAPRVVPSHLETMCVRLAIKEASSGQKMKYFMPIQEKPGLISLFSETIRELQRGCISPDDLISASLPDPKIEDTASVFRAFLEILTEHNWINSAGLLETAAQMLEKKQAVFPRSPLLVIDGFDQLTNDCIRFIKAVSPYFDEVLLTLPLTENKNRPVDEKLHENLKNIAEALQAKIVNLTNPHLTMFRQLSDQVLAPDSVIQDPVSYTQELIMIEEPFQVAESVQVLKQIKSCILKKAVSPGDCAIFVPDIRTYAPILRQASREMNVPMYFADHKKLSDAPAASVLIRLLHLSLDDFPSVNLLSVLRSPFLTGCPDPNDEEENSFQQDFYFLDKACKSMNIISGLAEWKDAFSVLEHEAEKSRDENDDEKTYDLPAPEKIRRIASSLDAFVRIITPEKGTNSIAGWADWLGKTLKSLRFFEQIDDKDDYSFENAFHVVLKRMVFAEENLKLPPIEFEIFLKELEDELDSSILSIQGSPSDRVFVGDMTQMNGGRWNTSAIMGFSESLFPRASKIPLILSDEIKKRLNIPTGLEQSLTLLHALTRAEKTLIISRPQKTDKGEEWPPSVYWRTLIRVLSGWCKKPDEKEDLSIVELAERKLLKPAVNGAASLDELAFDLSRAGCGKIPENLPPELQTGLMNRIANAKEALEIKNRQETGAFGPQPDTELRDAIRKMDQAPRPYSCSAIEVFLNCPFRYFLSRNLGLEVQVLPGTGMDAAQRGTLNHRVMELTFPSGTVYSSAEEALEKAKQVIPEVLAAAPDEFGFRVSELWEFEKENITQKLLESIEAMFKDKKFELNSHWKSLGAEIRFGYTNDKKTGTEPLEITTPYGNIKIRGVIDRLDVRDDGLLRVLDYKTGGKGFTASELASGSHIQAGIYAAAAVNTLKYGEECIGGYWDINGKKYHETASYKITDETVPDIEFLDCFAEGIAEADFPAAQAFSSCPEYCPASAWCRKYSRSA